MDELTTVAAADIETYFITWTDQHTLGNKKNWLKWCFRLHEKNSKGGKSQFFPFLIVLSSNAVSVLNENEDIKQSYTQWQNNTGNKEIKFIPYILTSEYKKYEKQQFLHLSSDANSSCCLTRYENCPLLLCLFYWLFFYFFFFF